MNKFLKIILSLVVHGWLNYRTRLVFKTCLYLYNMFHSICSSKEDTE